MTEHLIASTIVEDRFWIVEDESHNRVATIQSHDDGTVDYVDERQRKTYASFKMLSKAHNIKAADKKRPVTNTSLLAYGYRTAVAPHNVLWNVKHDCAVYTKDADSKSFYCAGYFAVKLGRTWTQEAFPKLITVNRYSHKGPFKTADEAKEAVRILNELQSQSPSQSI